MDSRKLAACGSGVAGRWRRVAVGLAVAVTVGLLVVDVMVHLSSREEGSVAKQSPRDRSRRSVNLTSSVRNATPIPAGAVYTHWGRSDCPTSAQIVYKGIIGSSQSTHTGGGGEYICLTDEPEWLSSISEGSYMYGVEYQTNAVGMTAGQNAVCTVCQSTHANKLMIPGRTSCVDGWTREYYGYLMTAKYSDKSTRNFICVDKNSQADWASYAKDGGGTLWHVGGSCGSLPCPKYTAGGEITCVLCTR